MKKALNKMSMYDMVGRENPNVFGLLSLFGCWYDCK